MSSSNNENKSFATKAGEATQYVANTIENAG